MGLLDDLELPTEAVRQGGQEQRTFADGARDAMRRLFTHCTNLSHTLNAARPDVRADYRLEDFGDLLDLSQGSYAVNTDDPVADLKAFSMTAVCESPGDLTFSVEGNRVLMEQRSAYLRKHHLSFTFEEMFKEAWGHSKGDHLNGAFFVQCKVPVILHFAINNETRRIDLTIDNLARIGQERMPLKLAVINDELLAELEPMLLRKPNRLNELAGFAVKTDMRSKLQARLAKEAELKQQQLDKLSNKKKKKKPFLGGLFGKPGKA